MCYVPQGRNIFPEFPCGTTSSSAAWRSATGRLAGRVEAMMQRFPVLREKAERKLPRSGGQRSS